MRRSSLAAACVAAAAFAASPAVSDPLFVDVSASRNIDFVGSYGSTFDGLSSGNALLQRNMGNGAAVGDYDRDGDLDIYLLGQLGHSNRLLRNDLDLGTKGFTDVTGIAGVGDTGLSRVAHFVDLDNDGDLDLVLVNDDDGSGDYPASKIFRNEGDGTFVDVTVGSGFNPVGYIRGGAAIADYDQDGLLDIYVTNWYYLTQGNQLYRNLGGLTFQEVTARSGLGTLDVGSFSAIFHDFDGDLFPDLYVAVDHDSDEFYWNEQGTFVNATAAMGATHTGNDMGLAAADFDNDDDLDLYATNITDPSGAFGTTQYNVLNTYQTLTEGDAFVDEAAARGVEDSYWGWGVEFTDVENDGDLDIVAVTGFDEYVSVVVGPSSPIFQTPSVLFVNDSTGHFSRQTFGQDDDSRALIAFDYDRDGDEDLLITNVDQPVRLLENVSDPQGHWLEVELEQAGGANREGIGATVYAMVGATTRRRDVICGESFLAGTPREVHFGLGAASTVDELRVRWTDGTETTYADVQADRRIVIVQGFADQDLDGVADAEDCAPNNAALWSPPNAVADLQLEGSPETTVNWSAPQAPGASSWSFDLLRGESADLVTGFVCLAAEAGGDAVVDSDVPTSVFFYVVRVTNGCGQNSGMGQGGIARALPSCS